MNKTPACWIFLRLLIGTVLGIGIGALNGNIIFSMQLGAMAGVFIAWVLTAPALQKWIKGMSAEALIPSLNFFGTYGFDLGGSEWTKSLDTSSLVECSLEPCLD